MTRNTNKTKLNYQRKLSAQSNQPIRDAMKHYDVHDEWERKKRGKKKHIIKKHKLCCQMEHKIIKKEEY